MRICNKASSFITSPPFALQRQKEYGNQAQNEYVDWFLEFAKIAKEKLKDTGSFVVDLGGAYCKGRPVRSLYQYRLLIKMVDELGYNLAEEFFWYNPSKLPSPIEWVNKRKIRAKDSVNTNWWFSVSDMEFAYSANVQVSLAMLLQSYSEPVYATQKRGNGEWIVVSQPDRLIDAIKKRVDVDIDLLLGE